MLLRSESLACGTHHVATSFKPESLHIRVHAGTHPLKGPDEALVFAGKVGGQAVIVAHIGGNDVEGKQSKVFSMDGRKRRDWHTEIIPIIAVFGLRAKTFNGEVLGVVSAVVPADGGPSGCVHRSGRLEVIMPAAEFGLAVRVHLD